MTKIKLDTQALGFASVDTEGTYMGGPVAPDTFPSMMRRKFIGDASKKVVRLADIYRVPGIVDSGLTKNIHSGDVVKVLPDRI
jgi:hypothetical protein